MSLFAIAMFTQVLDYYGEKLAQQHMDASNESFLGLLASFAGTMVLQHTYATEGQISLATVIAFLLLLFGSKLLADATGTSLSTSSIPSSSARGTLLGYAPDGLPLYHLNLSTGKSLLQTIKHALRSVMENNDSRQIFYFICLNFTFMLTEFTYGCGESERQIQREREAEGDRGRQMWWGV